MRQNMGAVFGKCLGQGKDKNGEQQQDGYSKIVRLSSNGELKITKSNLKMTVQQEIDQGYLEAKGSM